MKLNKTSELCRLQFVVMFHFDFLKRFSSFRLALKKLIACLIKTSAPTHRRPLYHWETINCNPYTISNVLNLSPSVKRSSRNVEHNK
jgi:hypothetical protein